MLKCPAEMQVAGVAETWHAWRSALDGGPQCVILDASELRTIDTAGLQMLVATVGALREKAIPWRWESCSSQLADAIERLGLSELLGTLP
jgi:anti-anti-sigma regulatory factor